LYSNVAYSKEDAFFALLFSRGPQHLTWSILMKFSLVALVAGCALAGSAFAALDNPPSAPPNLAALDNPPSAPPNLASLDNPPSAPPNFAAIDNPPSAPPNFA
jgi:hypothetical protein